MNYILLHKSYGAVSTRRVVEKMKEPCNLVVRNKEGKWSVYSPETESMEEETQDCLVDDVANILYDSSNHIINWGNHIFGNNYDKFFALNRPSAVALSSNKRISRGVLQNAGVPVPVTHFLESYVFLPVMKYPIIARPPHHHAGKNFHIVQSESDFSQFVKSIDLGWYFSEIFEKTHEFRVHAAHGKVLVTHEKPLIPGELRANQAINHEKWRALKWSEFIPAVSLAALEAVEVLGLDYGAVDVMYNAENGKVAIAEVNTSPEITAEYTSGKYAEYFDWVIRHNFPAHFEPEGTSVFYNTILRS
jgi:Glutathione synthase/Ribosomal protein S6 modification enzyme (glutaminyl transferase)